MPALNGPAGYGAVTKTLHWLTVLALITQFAVCYGLETVSEWVSGTDDSDADEAGVFVHGWIGGGILVLASVRLIWRWTTPLPPWSERLTASNRRLESLLEKVLYVLLFAIPLSGLGLLFLSGEERDVAEDVEWQPPYELVDSGLLLAAHITGHLLFYVTVAIHIGIAVRRRTLTRMLTS